MKFVCIKVWIGEVYCVILCDLVAFHCEYHLVCLLLLLYYVEEYEAVGKVGIFGDIILVNKNQVFVNLMYKFLRRSELSHWTWPYSTLVCMAL